MQNCNLQGSNGCSKEIRYHDAFGPDVLCTLETVYCVLLEIAILAHGIERHHKEHGDWVERLE